MPGRKSPSAEVSTITPSREAIQVLEEHLRVKEEELRTQVEKLVDQEHQCCGSTSLRLCQKCRRAHQFSCVLIDLWSDIGALREALKCITQGTPENFPFPICDRQAEATLLSQHLRNGD